MIQYIIYTLNYNKAIIMLTVGKLEANQQRTRPTLNCNANICASTKEMRDHDGKEVTVLVHCNLTCYLFK